MSSCGSTPAELSGLTANLNNQGPLYAERTDITGKRPAFQHHCTNTQRPPHEQAGTGVPRQPSVAPNIDSLLNNKGTFMTNTNQNNGNRNLAQQQDVKEQIDSAVATTNSLAGSFQAIATAYGDYTRSRLKTPDHSWRNSRA